MTDTIETTPTAIAFLDEITIHEFIQEFVGKTVIATHEVDDDDKVIKQTFDLNLTDFPMIALEKFLSYGMQRVFNDAVGGLDKYPSTESKMEAVQDMIDDYKNGIVKKARSSAKPITDLVTLARQLAKKSLKIQLAESKDMDYKLDFLDNLTTAEQNEYLDGMCDDDDQYMTAAQAELDGRVTAKKTIDLSKLPKRKS